MATTAKCSVALSTADLDTVAIYTDATGTSFNLDSAAINTYTHCRHRHCSYMYCSHILYARGT